MTEQDTKQLADFVRDMRSKKNLSQADVAKRGGPSSGWIGSLEAGILKTAPKPATLAKLAKGLGVPEQEVFAAAGYHTAVVSQEAVDSELNDTSDDLSREESTTDNLASVMAAATIDQVIELVDRQKIKLRPELDQKLRAVSAAAREQGWSDEQAKVAFIRSYYAVSEEEIAATRAEIERFLQIETLHPRKESGLIFQLSSQLKPTRKGAAPPEKRQVEADIIDLATKLDLIEDYRSISHPTFWEQPIPVRSLLLTNVERRLNNYYRHRVTQKILGITRCVYTILKVDATDPYYSRATVEILSISPELSLLHARLIERTRSNDRPFTQLMLLFGRKILRFVDSVGADIRFEHELARKEIDNLSYEQVKERAQSKSWKEDEAFNHPSRFDTIDELKAVQADLGKSLRALEESFTGDEI